MDETNKKQMPRARRVHIGPEAYKRLNQVWSKLEERGAKDINRAELVEEAIDRLTDKYLDEYLQRLSHLELKTVCY